MLGNSSKVTVGSVDVPLIAHNETSVLDHCYYKTRKRCFSASDFFHNINQNKEKTDFCKRIAEVMVQFFKGEVQHSRFLNDWCCCLKF